MTLLEEALCTDIALARRGSEEIKRRAARPSRRARLIPLIWRPPRFTAIALAVEDGREANRSPLGRPRWSPPGHGAATSRASEQPERPSVGRARPRYEQDGKRLLPALGAAGLALGAASFCRSPFGNSPTLISPNAIQQMQRRLAFAFNALEFLDGSAWQFSR